MRGKNVGMSKAMALYTLGNAYVYLREVYASTPWTPEDGGGLTIAADVLRTAFEAVQTDFALLDFTEKG